MHLLNSLARFILPLAPYHAMRCWCPQVCLEFTADLPETDLELQRWLGEPGGQITGRKVAFFGTDLTP